MVEKLDKAIMADPLVADVMSFSGMDAVSGAAKTNVATFFFTLKPWGERKAPGDSSLILPASCTAWAWSGAGLVHRLQPAADQRHEQHRRL